jgi:hypothetical protein
LFYTSYFFCLWLVVQALLPCDEFLVAFVLSLCDDTTNVTRARGAITDAAYEVGRNPNQESQSNAYLLRL